MQDILYNNKKRLFALTCCVFVACILCLPIIHYLRNITGDYNYPPQVAGTRYPTILLFSVFFISYWFYLKLRTRYFYDERRRSFIVLLLLLGVYICAIWPVFSIDMYEYISRGRMISLYHANPYLHPPRDFPNDRFYPIIFYKNAPMWYGPAWTLLAWLPTRIAGNTIFMNQFLMKLMLFVFYLLSGLQIYRLAKLLDYKKPLIYAEAFLLNPFLLITFLMDGHNDIVMIFFFLYSLVELERGRDLLSVALLVISVLTKYLTVIFIPIYAVRYYFKYKGVGGKLIFASKAAFLSLLIVFLAFRPLWVGFDTFKTIAMAAARFHDNTISYVIYKISALFLTGLKEATFMIFSKASFLALYALILAVFLRSKRDLTDIVKAIIYILIGYYCLASFQFGPWYIGWIVPFIIISELPMSFFLQALLGFAALISFWKRISFLLIAAVSVYILVCWLCSKSSKYGASLI